MVNLPDLCVVTYVKFTKIKIRYEFSIKVNIEPCATASETDFLLHCLDATTTNLLKLGSCESLEPRTLTAVF